MGESGGFFLQTPEFLKFKEARAKSTIGRYLLIAALYEKGVVVGHRFKPRQQEPHQWLYELGSDHLMAAWSEDWASFKALEQIVYNIEIGEENLFGPEHLSTAPSVYKKVARQLRREHVERMPIQIDALFIDIPMHKIMKVDFSGTMDSYIAFGILGGLEYQDPLTKEEMKIIMKAQISGGLVTPAEQTKLDEGDKKAFHAPLKEAILHLESLYQGKEYLDTKDAALDAVRTTLLLCDPLSKSEEFELNVFEEGEITSARFTREKQVARGGTPPLPQDLVFDPDSGLFGIEVEFTPEGESNGGNDDENNNEPQA